MRRQAPFDLGTMPIGETYNEEIGKEGNGPDIRHNWISIGKEGNGPDIRPNWISFNSFSYAMFFKLLS